MRRLLSRTSQRESEHPGMAGPGGREVGRVSVRAVPDTDGFGAKLKRFLDKIEKAAVVEVRLEIDDRALRRLPRNLPALRPDVVPDTAPAERAIAALGRQLDTLSGDVDLGADTSAARADLDALLARIRTADPELDLEADTAKALAKVDALLARVDGADADLDVGADTAKAFAEVEALLVKVRSSSATVTVKTRIDDAGLGGIGGGDGLSALTSTFTTLLGAGAKVPAMIGGVVGGLTSLISTGSEAADSTGQLVGGLGRLGSSGAAAAAGVLAVGVAAVKGFVDFGLWGGELSATAAVLGAVTFAAGAAGAAVSALPAILFGAAAAGGAFYLGLDGIKQAANAAKPALDLLKTQVSAVFARELTPAFERLGAVLPQLRAGFEFVATGGARMVKELLGVVTSTRGVQQLQAVLGNTRVLIENMTPGVVTLVATLLEVATVGGVYRELGLLVSDLSLQFASLFARFAAGGESSLMVRAFTQLRGVVSAAVGAFSELLIGATEFFVQAGPGVTEFFGSLQRVIDKIDFKGLGASFGIFAGAVGRFFESVPQATWDTLSASVREVAEKFAELAGDPAIQGFFATLIMTIPVAIRTFADLLGAVRAVVNVFLDVWQSAKLSFLSFVDGVLAGAQSVLGGIAMMVGAIPGLPASWRDAAIGAVGSIGEMRVGVGQGITDTIADMDARRGPAEAAGTAIGAGAAAGAQAGIAPMPGQMGADAARAAEAVRGKGQAATGAGRMVGAGAAGGAQAGIAPMPGQMGAETARAAERVRGQQQGFRGAGGQLSEGLRGGIASGASRVIAAAVDIASRAFAAAKRFLGIASPSKLFRYQIGARITQGWALALEQGRDVVGSAMTRLTAHVAGIAENAGMHGAGQDIGERLGAGMTAGIASSASAVAAEVARVASQVDVAASSGGWDAPGTVYEDGSVRGGARRNFSDEDLRALADYQAEAMTGLAVELTPEGVARLARKGERILGRL